MTTPKTTDETVRPELLPLPARIAALPVSRGYPVPWFVAWVDGAPEFRVMDGHKLVRAVQERLCWVCGKPLGSFLAFTVGPMCAVNRISAEPPSHRECATFSAQACPFLTRPHMRRREGDMPEEATKPGGMMLERNPGVALVWVTKGYRIARQPHAPPLFRMGDPTAWLAFAHGTKATPAELRESVVTGVPLLLAAAEQDGPDAVQALERELRAACALLHIDPVPLRAACT